VRKRRPNQKRGIASPTTVSTAAKRNRPFGVIDRLSVVAAYRTAVKLRRPRSRAN